MARYHKGIAYGVAGILGVGIFGSWAVGNIWSMATSSDEKQEVVAQEPGFTVQVGEKPKPEPEQKPTEQTLTQKIDERRKDAGGKQQPDKKESLTDKWLTNVNKEGMYAFGEDNGYSGANNSDAECSTSVPVRVVAMVADSATTDAPGMALGMISNDVQGTDSSGGYCVAIPGGAVVTFDAQKAAEYSTNRVPTQVNTIWMHDGFKVEVNQPAKHIDGIPGVIGKANHHTFSKTFAAIGSVAFGLANNVTRAFSFNSSQVTNPVEDSMKKTLERPSEITFTGGKVVEFDLMPTSTPGYSE